MVIVRPLYVATTTVSLRDPLGLGLESMGAAVDSAAKRRYQAAVCPYQLPTVTAAADDISHLYDMFGPETKADRRTTVNGVVSEDDDEFVYCPDCDGAVLGFCQTHNWTRIPDKQKPDRISGAMGTLPDCLEVKKSKIAGLGTFAREKIKKNSVFGPYGGTMALLENKDVANNGYSWEIRKGLKHAGFHINALDPQRSNWLRYVNCARYEQEQNLVAFQCRAQVFYRSLCDIPVGQELAVWYGDEYGKELGLIPK